MLFRTLPYIVVCFTVLSCTKGESLRTVREYEGQWKKAKTPDYSYVIFSECECSRETYSPARIVVRDNEIFRVEDVFTGLPMRTKNASTLAQNTHSEYFYTIDGLFDLILDSKRPDERQILFHEELGYPISIYLDQNAKVSGDELTFEIHELVFE